MACNNMGSYGKMARYKGIDRISNINGRVALCSWGEQSDFLHVTRELQNMNRKDKIEDDGQHFTPVDYGNYLSKINYDKRNKFNPHYINSVIGGFEDGKRYLASVDLHGMKLEQ